MTTPSVQTTTTRFGRLEHRGILLGLGAAQLALLTIAMVIAVGGVYSAGLSGLVAGAVVWLPLAIAGTASVRGRPVVEWVPLIAHWHARRLLGKTTLVTRVGAQARDLQIPGVPGSLRVTETPNLAAALIHDRRAGTLTAIAGVRGEGFVLDDASAQEHKVAAWGRVLASLCQQPMVVRVQLVLRTVPDGAAGARRWWRENARAETSWAAGLLADLIDEAYYTARRQDAFVAIALRDPRGHRRRLTARGGERFEQELVALTDALRGAELTVDHWVSLDRLGATLRPAYDPVGAARAGDPGEVATKRLLGPMGVQEHWSYLRTDSAVHATYWVTQWPRNEVHPSFLQPLLLAPTGLRTVTLIAEPLPTAKALREIRRAKVEHAADAAQRARVGRVEDELIRAQVADLARREQELIAGHGDLRFTGLITVTAATLEELDGACAATESAAAQSMCEIRRLVGQQGLAHVAATLALARGVL
ncbi:valine--tRNA ligase [Cellulomonas sp. P24]|uniref:valine--tRNA ligase n=1 Tax=Cellulomonas sp. P24 TaxID=2885206 RepID=UPI00216ADAE7|nr:valine--tRNA ligase [Cellulomonas sp. P24]MCR6494536.1 valine--tRNA ligase [Cellulomonas sp. P24]